MSKAFKTDDTSACIRHRKAVRGWLELDGTYFLPFVGNVILTRTWRGERFLVDRWGGVWPCSRPGDDGNVTLTDEYTEPFRGRGYMDGFKAIVHASAGSDGRVNTRRLREDTSTLTLDTARLS